VEQLRLVIPQLYCNPSADGLLEPANGVPSDAVESSNVGWSKSGRRTPDPEIPAPLWNASDEETHVIVEL
jgi:hypothetical protein